jgi:hypothetical protein
MTTKGRGGGSGARGTRWAAHRRTEVSRGGHGGGVRLVTAVAAPALLSCWWKKPAGLVGPKTPSGPVQRPRPVGLIKEK